MNNMVQQWDIFLIISGLGILYLMTLRYADVPALSTYSNITLALNCIIP